MIDLDTRLRVGRAIGKDETEVAAQLMEQLKRRGHPETPPARATDGQGSYREAMVDTWGQVPPYSGRGRPPSQPQAGADWQLLQVIKRRAGHRLMGMTINGVYGDPEEVRALMGPIPLMSNGPI